jgi:hypothetical protein
MCITFSIRQVMRITYVENKLWKKEKKRKKCVRSAHVGALDGAHAEMVLRSCSHAKLVMHKSSETQISLGDNLPHLAWEHMWARAS